MCVHVCVCALVLAFEHACALACVRVHVCVHMRVWAHACVCVCMHVGMGAHAGGAGMRVISSDC